MKTHKAAFPPENRLMEFLMMIPSFQRVACATMLLSSAAPLARAASQSSSASVGLALSVGGAVLTGLAAKFCADAVNFYEEIHQAKMEAANQSNSASRLVLNA